MVLVQLGADRRVYRTRAEMEWVSSLSVIVLESENGNRGTQHQKEYDRLRKKRCIQGESHYT